MTSTMDMAYRLAALAVRRRLAEHNLDQLVALDRIRGDQVAVYTGTFDQAEEVFRRLGVPVTVNPCPDRLVADIVYVNCSREYPARLVETIRGHVESGRHLVTSDWALHYVLAPSFPNTLAWTGQQAGERVISLEPAGSSLWSDIVVLGADPQWWLWGSYPIRVLDPERVRVEAASHDLLCDFGAPAVACSFDWMAGHVFHVISHFWAKKTGTPTSRHSGTGRDFLECGMRLSPTGVEEVLREAGRGADNVGFAALQSACTATELVAQLCLRAVSRVGSAA